MATNTDIPQGYKATALGIIPQEWEVMLLGNLSNSISSGRNKHRDVNGQYPVFGSTGIIGYSSTYEYEGPVILVARVGANAGTLNFASGQYDVSDNTLIITIKQNVYDYNFAYNQLTHYKLNKLVFGSGQPLITSKQLKNIRIPVPPLAEQQKIAEVLGVWDEAIEKQARLIEKLALRKRGLMQRLLSAKLRLPGFSEPWKKVKLGDIGDTYNGLSGKNKDDFEYGNAQFIPYINVFSNERIDTNNLGCVQIKPNEQQNTVKYGDIFFTVSSETPDEVGMASVLLEHLDNTYLNSFCFGYRLNNFSTLNPFFAAYLFRTEHFRNYMSVLAQGSTRFNISKKEVMKLKIDLPTIEEQTSIAEVLTAADREIELAKEKLERLRRQKRGLMQQLLTGKKRVNY